MAMDDLVETITNLELPLEWYPRNLLPEEQQYLHEHWTEHTQHMRAEQEARERQLFALYRRLSPEQGRAVALYALDLFDAGRYRSQYLTERMLLRVANLVPGALQGLYSELIERELFWRSQHCEADPTTRDQLLLLLEEKAEDLGALSTILEALAWIGDEQVQAQFHKWRQSPPTWRSLLYIPPHGYALLAGWELTEDGKRRNLCHTTAYELIPTKHAAPEATPGPVGVIERSEEHCRWCGLLLTTLFDLDLRDPRLAFLGVRGERLRIAMCERCPDPIITDVDLRGGSHWSASNPSKPEIEYEGWEIEPLPKGKLVLGPQRRTPYETIGAYQRRGISQLGGYPEWVQDAEYPRCPGCQRRMTFLGQLETLDIVEHAEGIYYAFLCADCGKATTGYQQT
ncbi:MAG TPA: hypothetical protein VH540_15650 [Ktedonobacterales bacterium]